MASVETFIARRYLTSKRNVRFINIIGYISVAGITIGVAALLIALSVFNGFNSVVTSVLVGFDPHIRLEKKGSMTVNEYFTVERVLQSNPRIAAYSPFVSGKAMLSTKAFNKVVYVRGVDEQRVAEVSGVKGKIIFGSLSLRDTDAVAGIVIGLSLADRLAALIGDEIIVYSPAGVQTALSGVSMPPSQKFRVEGIFDSNNKDYDANYAYVSLPAAQHLFELDNKYNGVEMRLHDFTMADDVKKELSKQLSSDISISTWYDLHQSLYSVMKIERWSAFVLLTLIILVATFNMLGSLTMGVMEKRRDIAVLKSLGMTPRRIIRLFMREGMLIGAVGTVAGILIGLVVLVIQITYHIFPLDPTIYIIPAIPVEIRWTDFCAIAIASLGLSFLAAYYPARRAASTMPAEALRWE
ncbi:MAG: ABC transporter permease [Ignavibacteria bacterium]|nr:ABC transporter permease [Ignavibacteria bacterium]MBI3765007.1 ABC transporter permease [Ignavibacteriales bacterium]